MPTYEYYCPTNQRTADAMHGMSETIETWGDLCARADLDPGTTSTDAPVEKLLGAGMVIQKSERLAGGACDTRPMGGCCGGGCGGH